jgi:type I restriction enzyme S subunit
MAASEIRRVAIREVALVNAHSIKGSSTPSRIEYIDISSVGTGEFTEPPKLMSFADAPSRARRIVKAGDTILSTVRPNRRSFLFLASPSSIAVASTGFAVLTPTPNVDARYLYYWVTRQDFTDYLSLHAKGAAYPAVSAEDIGGAEIDLPPLPVQQRIAGILSAYDELIENSQRRIKILESMARALYREWFVHFRFPGFEHHPCVASPLGEIPQGWEVVSFEHLLSTMTGGDWGSEQPEDRDTVEVIVVRGTDFDEVAYGGQLRAPVRYIKPSSLVSRGLKVGDVIIENSINAKSRSVGTTLLVDKHVLNRLGRDAIAASFCKVFRLHDPRLAPLVHLRVRHLREDARMEYYQNVAANGIANFQAQKFAKEEQLILPTDDAMRARLIEPIASIFQSVGILASQLSNLRRTRDLLLPRLLSGQIDMEEFEDA